jgi:hypothetical protein
MSAMTDFESLKQQIVDVITKEPTIRYTLVGWMTDEFVPKSDYSKILDEIRELRENSDKRWEDADKRFNSVQNEIRELRESSDKRWEAADKRFDAMQQDMQKGFNRLALKIDKLGGRWGIRAETAFRQGLSSLIQEFFDGEVAKWETEDTEGCVYGHTCRVELDIVIRNGKCIVVEIKSQVGRAEVAAFNRIVELYHHQTNVTPDRRVLIVADIDSAARDLAHKMGIEVFTMEEVEQQIA